MRALFTKLIVAATCWALFSSVHAAGDVAAGKYAFATCSGCHAIPGYTNVYPTYHVPLVGGQHADYIVAALKAYQVGERDHDTMLANAANLSEEDMANIAAFLTSFEPSGEEQRVRGDVKAGEQKAAEAGCAACHGADGNSPAPTFPRIAGQFEDYLVQTLKDYRSGARKQAIMNPIAGALSDQDIANLAAFFASQSSSLAVVEFDGSQ